MAYNKIFLPMKLHPALDQSLIISGRRPEEVGHSWPLLVRSLTRVPFEANYFPGTWPTSSPSYSRPRELWPTHF